MQGDTTVIIIIVIIILTLLEVLKLHLWDWYTPKQVQSLAHKLSLMGIAHP